MKFHAVLPEGAYKVRWPCEMYRLLPRKKNLYKDNREYREGIRYLVWSFYSRKYYERYLSSAEPIENIDYFVNRGILFLYPQGEYQDEIREEVEKSGLSYYKLRWRQHNEWLWEEKKAEKNDGNGYNYWLQYRRSQIDKLKTKKK